jgi:hypothetical protein
MEFSFIGIQEEKSGKRKVEKGKVYSRQLAVFRRSWMIEGVEAP